MRRAKTVVRWGAAVLAMAVVSLALSAGAAEKTRFSNYIDDLPIMPGLTENSDGYVVDLIQGGRVAEARLAGSVDAQVVRGFYAATLVQLGWKPMPNDPSTYMRGRERLSFTVETGRGRKRLLAQRGLEAVFVLSPDTPVAAGAMPQRR